MIGLVLVWKVEETYRAAFGVDEYEHFVVVQSEAACVSWPGCTRMTTLKTTMQKLPCAMVAKR